MIDTDQRERMFTDRVRGFDEASPGYADLWKRARNAILQHGGITVVPSGGGPDPHLALIAEFGEYMDGASAELRRGRVSQCHTNSVALRVRGVGAVWTGYALSDDGLWRQHTWVRTDTGTVVETTAPRMGYFGVLVLSSIPAPDVEPDDDYRTVYHPDGTSMVGEPDLMCTDCGVQPGSFIVDDVGEESICWDCLTKRAEAEEAEERS